MNKRIFSVALVTCALVSALSRTALAMDSEPLTIASGSALPADKQEYLIELGRVVTKALIDGDEIDFINANYFEELDYQSFKSKVAYSRLASFAVISNGIRWFFTSTDDNYINERKNRLTAIAGVVWYLTSIAEEQGELFARGSFSIIDPSHRLANFLLDYVKLVTDCENPIEKHCAMTQSNFAYRRLPEKGGSSHHLGRTPEGQFGIDLRFEANETLMTILPFSMAHVLFGALDVAQDTPLLFLKFEPVGLGSSLEFANHSLHFLQSGTVEGQARREKDILPHLSDIFAGILSMTFDSQAHETLGQMYLYVQNLLEQPELSTELIDELELFSTAIDEAYPEGRHELRTGNEVIIDLSQLH